MADSETNEVLQSLIDTIGLCEQKIKEGSLGQVMEDLEEGFSLEDFWLKLGMTLRAVSKEATKLTVSFSKPPAPSANDLQCLLTGFETSVIAMLTIFRSLPLSQGLTLHKKLQDLITLVLGDCQALAMSFLKEGCTSVSSAKTQSTGTLWEHCDSLNNLPKDNKQAVVRVLQSNLELIKDALLEAEEAQKCNGCQAMDESDDEKSKEQGWSDDDKLLVSPCIGLVKACRASLKKISGAIRTAGEVTTAESIQHLDVMAEKVQNTSPSVDDIVTSFYSPMNHHHVSEAASKLANQLKDMLSKARNSHFTMESDSQWLDFLDKAVDHNFNNLTGLLLKQRKENT